MKTIHPHRASPKDSLPSHDGILYSISVYLLISVYSVYTYMHTYIHTYTHTDSFKRDIAYHITCRETERERERERERE